jgi:hypothetical protein
MSIEKYDSTADTLYHIRRVNELLIKCCRDLLARAWLHDNSKLREPEKGIFDTYTPVLKTLKYGSDEYKDNLKNLQVALTHHYQHNSHHPEHYEGGVNDMTLLDVLEMLMDWKAATERHEDGDILKSIEINTKRFGLSEQLSRIFINTIEQMGLQTQPQQP